MQIASIQRGEATLSTGGAVTVTLSAEVDTAKSLILINGDADSTSGSGGIRCLISAYFTDGETVEIENGYTAGTVVVHWEVIEFTNASVQHFAVSVTSNGQTQAVATVDMDSTLLVTSWIHGGTTTVGPAQRDGALAVTLTDVDEVTIDLYSTASIMTGLTVYVSVVEFDSGVFVQRGLDAAPAVGDTITLSTAVDPSKCVTTTWNNATGTYALAYNSMGRSLVITDTTEGTWGDGSGVDATWEVIEVDSGGVQEGTIEVPLSTTDNDTSLSITSVDQDASILWMGTPWSGKTSVGSNSGPARFVSILRWIASDEVEAERRTGHLSYESSVHAQVLTVTPGGGGTLFGGRLVNRSRLIGGRLVA